MLYSQARCFTVPTAITSVYATSYLWLLLFFSTSSSHDTTLRFNRLVYLNPTAEPYCTLTGTWLLFVLSLRHGCALAVPSLYTRFALPVLSRSDQAANILGPLQVLI